MKKALTCLLAFVMLSTSIYACAETYPAVEFEDVNQDDWFYSCVQYGVNNGLFVGTSENTFSPDMNITRGMFVTVLGRSLDVEASYFMTVSFDDVKPDSYYAPYLEWAYKSGIVLGNGEGSALPDESITRQDMAVILQRIYGAEYDVSKVDITHFGDVNEISSYAVDAVKWAVDTGTMIGDGENYNPEGNTTRGQAAQVFYNLSEQELKPITLSLFVIDTSKVTSVIFQNGNTGEMKTAFNNGTEFTEMIDVVNEYKYTACKEVEPADGWSYRILIIIGQDNEAERIDIYIKNQDEIEVGDKVYTSDTSGYFYDFIKEAMPSWF